MLRRSRYRKSHSFVLRYRKLFAAMLPFCAATALALPEGGVAIHGDMSVSQNDGRMTIQQLDQQVISQWQSFSINADETVNILQPNANSALLNRVTGADPSALLGQLTSNGRVYLINPNGILVGEGAHINVGEFLASTLDIADAEFLAGDDQHFTGNSGAGLLNLGHIETQSGDLVLLAATITNAGTLSANNGTVILGAGQDILLSKEANQRLIVRSDVSGYLGEQGVSNEGLIQAAEIAIVAAGGDVYDLAINQSGMVKATGVAHKNGRILLTAEGGDILFSGLAGAQQGNGAGGEIVIGGGERGEDAAIANAATVTVTRHAELDVSSVSGDAGSVTVWSDDRTEFSATVDGTSQSGRGAYVEVSGGSDLLYSGLSNLTGESFGTLLLDPDALVIQVAAGGANVLQVATLEANLAMGNVDLDASTVDLVDPDQNGNITFSDAVSWNSGTTLSVNAGDNLTVNASLNAGTGDINLNAGFPSFDGTTGNLVVDAAATITANLLTLSGGTATVLGSNSPDGPIGDITVNGILNVSTLDIALPGTTFGPGGADGDISIANPSNQIGVLTNSGAETRVGGALTVVDGSGDLTVTGTFAVEGGDINITTADDLTLDTGAALSTGVAGHDVFLAASTGSFVNNVGGAAVSAGGAGRFLIYSDEPDNTTLGGLLVNPVYNKNIVSDPAAGVAETGNRVLYSLAPTLTLSANNQAKAEDEVNPGLSFSFSGLVGSDAPGDAFSGSPILTTTALTNSPIGDYPISISQGSVVLSDFGYGLSLVPGTLSIQLDPARTLTVSADDLIRLYGDPNPVFTADITGFRAGDDASLVSGLLFSTAATPDSPVGNYTITPSSASATNYSFTYVPGTLTVDLRPLTITADSRNKLFGEVLTDLSFNAVGLASFDEATDLGPVAVTSAGATSLAGVGDYAVSASGANNPNYNVTYIDGTVSVSPAALTVTAADKSRSYGGVNPAFTFSTTGLVSGDSLDTGALMFSTAATSASSVGNYPVTPSGIVDANYTISFVPGTLSVTAAPLTVTASNAFRDYGSPNPDFGFTTSGLQLTDTIEQVIPNLAVFTTATQGSNAGTYAIDLSGDAATNNYAVSFATGTLTVAKVDVNLFLGPVTRVYGDDNPTPPVVAFGLVNGDDASAIQTVITSIPVPAGAAPGTYATQFLGANATNYNVVSVNNGIMTVLQRPLTLRADNATREYGDDNPVLTATFEGLASFDDESVIPDVSVSTIATRTSNVLDYGINVTSGANSNYDISYEQGLLSITPAVVTLGTDDSERIYGRATPELQVTYFNGLKGDDDFDSLIFQFDTVFNATSGVGEYPIGGVINNPNYELNLFEGTFFVRPAPLSVNVRSAARTYGEANPEDIVVNVAGLAFADRPDVVSVTNPTDPGTNIGTYNFDVDLTTDNYVITDITGGLFTILPRKIAIKPQNIVKYYGDPDPEFTYLVAADGLASVDTIDDVVFTDLPVLTGSFGLQAPVGARTVQAQLTGNPNYTVASRQGYYVILPRPIEITVQDADAVGNFPLPRFVATATNLPSFDTVDSAFPDLSFRLFQEDEPAPIGMATTIEAFEIPAVYSDENFLTQFPPTITTPEVEFEPGTTVVEFETVPIEVIEIPGSDSEPVITLSSSFSINISSSLFTSEEQASREPVVQFIQARGGNPNYVVVANTNGRLTWSPDPAVAARQAAIDAELDIYNEAYDAFWNPDKVYGTPTTGLVISSSPIPEYNLLGLPEGAQTTVIEAIGIRLAQDAADGDDYLATLIANYGASARGTASGFQQLTGGAYSDFDVLAFLQAARTEPGAAELLGEIYGEYLTNLIEVDPADYNESQAVAIQALNGHARNARDTMVSGMEARYNEYLASAENDALTSGLSGLFGVDVPWADFMGEAAGDFVAEQVTAAVIGAGVAGAAGTAAATAVLAGTGAILPYAIAGGATASIAGGSAFAYSAVAAASGPAVIIAAAVAGSVARGVQVFSNAEQEKIYNDWQASKGQPFDVSTLSLENDKGEPNPVDQAILAGAIAAMLGGG